MDDIVVAAAVLHAIRRRKRRLKVAIALRLRDSLRRGYNIHSSSLLPSVVDCPWYILYANGSDDDFLNTVSLTRGSFDVLLREFAKHYEVSSGPGLPGRPQPFFETLPLSHSVCVSLLPAASFTESRKLQEASGQRSISKKAAANNKQQAAIRVQRPTPVLHWLYIKPDAVALLDYFSLLLLLRLCVVLLRCKDSDTQNTSEKSKQQQSALVSSSGQHSSSQQQQ